MFQTSARSEFRIYILQIPFLNQLEQTCVSQRQSIVLAE